MAGKHSIFAPSSAHRIATCPASLLRTKDLPDAPSPEAVEGSVAHAIHENVLNAILSGSDQVSGMRAADYIGMTAREVLGDDWSEEELKLVEDLVVDRAMADYVQESVDWCLETQGRHYVEVRVNTSKYTPIPDQGGTCDHACFAEKDSTHADGTLVITDLKFGKGVQVFAEKNHQLTMYALGFIEEHDAFYDFADDHKVVIRVSQPRLDHKDVWETTVGELREIGKYLLQRFTLAMKPKAPFGPDEHACKFCKLKPTCPALYQRSLELSKGWFDDLDAEVIDPQVDETWPLSAPDAKALTPKQVALVLQNRKLITDFLSSVEEHAMAMLMHSQPVPGFKLVEGRSYRQWEDEEFAIAFLEHKGVHPYTPPKILSPAEAEKKLKKGDRKALAGYIVKPKGKPTLAPEDDKREPYPLAVFDAVDEDEGL